MDPKRSFLEGMKKDLKSENNKGLDSKLGHLKKVTVAAPTSEGLEEGLDKAQEILQMRQSMMPKKANAKKPEEEIAEELSEDSTDELDAIPAEQTEDVLAEKFESLKDLSKEDMQKCVEFLQAMIAGKEAEEI